MHETFSCTYLGHTTLLLSINGVTLLTDPVFDARAGFFRRATPLPIVPSLLPEPTAILLSSTLSDHLQLSSFRFIASTIPVFVPPGTATKLSHFIENPIIEIAPFATHTIGNIEITSLPLPCRLFPFLKRSAAGYLIRSGAQTFFFMGDGAYGNHFREMAGLHPLDVALLPIGGYDPTWIMRGRHMTPPQAIQTFTDLKARHLIPIGWGTFSLSLEPLSEPIAWLERTIAHNTDLRHRTHIVKHGETWRLPEETSNVVSLRAG